MRQQDAQKDAEYERSFDGFKYEQDLKAKLWLAFVSALTALYFGKDIVERTGSGIPGKL